MEKLLKKYWMIFSKNLRRLILRYLVVKNSYFNPREPRALQYEAFGG